MKIDFINRCFSEKMTICKNPFAICKKQWYVDITTKKRG